MSTDDWIFVARYGNKYTEIRTTIHSGFKLAIVSQNTLNLRNFFDEDDLKFPNNTGISMTPLCFERLLSLQHDILNASDDLEMKKDQ